MGSISEKTDYLKETKSLIREAIINKGLSVSEDAPFREYATKIDNIPTSGTSLFTGSYDVEGLQQIGWTDEEIDFYNKYGVQWDEENNNVFKLNATELAGDTSKNTRFLPKNHELTSFGEYNRLIALPKVDASNLAKVWSLFLGCYSLTAINFDFSTATTAIRLISPFLDCINLKVVFLSGVPSGTNLRDFEFGDSSSLEFISIDSDVQNLFLFGCSSLKKIEVPSITYVTSADYAFAGCSHLKIVPPLKIERESTELEVYMQQMFADCSSLVSIPEFTISWKNNLYIEKLFQGCKSLLSIPDSLSKISVLDNLDYTFKDCALITTVPEMNTILIDSMVSTFEGCSSLLTIPQLNASSVSNITNVLKNCSSLTDFGGFVNLGEGYDTTQSIGYSDYTLDLSTCTSLTHDSLMNVINNLYDIKTAGCNVQYLNLGTTNKAKLTDEEIAVAENKGWSIQ